MKALANSVHIEKQNVLEKKVKEDMEKITVGLRDSDQIKTKKCQISG